MFHSSDAALFAKACEGNAQAARQLVQQLGPRAHALAWRILGSADEAQDVVQDGFVKLFDSRQFQGKSALATYFHVLVTRLCMDRFRRRRPELTGLDDAVLETHLDQTVDERQNPLNDLRDIQTASLIQQAMLHLPPRQRAALALWAYQDASMHEISTALDIDTNAAHQLLHRAKISLRSKLLEIGYVH